MFKLSIFLFFALLLNSCDNSNSENNAPFIIKDSFIVNNIDILEDSSAIEAENIIDDESELAYDSILSPANMFLRRTLILFHISTMSYYILKNMNNHIG